MIISDGIYHLLGYMDLNCVLCGQRWHRIRRYRRGDRREFRILCRCGLCAVAPSRTKVLSRWGDMQIRLEDVIESGAAPAHIRTHANQNGDGFSRDWALRWMPQPHGDLSRWNIIYEEDDIENHSILSVRPAVPDLT